MSRSRLTPAVVPASPNGPATPGFSIRLPMATSRHRRPACRLGTLLCFRVAAAGRGHKWQPEYRLSTPETVWEHWGLTQEQADRGRLNPKMFNSFLDGSKPAIESAAIANATGLPCRAPGLPFRPATSRPFRS